MRGKRGSHVGVMLSFVIFVTFLVLLYVVIRPAIITGEDKRITLEYLETEITENLSMVFMSTSVEINNTENPSQYCVVLKNLFLSLNITSPNIIVKNETGSTQSAYEDIFDLVIDRTARTNRYFKIHHSMSFNRLNTTTETCRDIDEGEYIIGSVQTGTYIFEKNVYDFINYYQSNYEALKSQLKVPPRNEFGFGFHQSNGTEINVEQETTSANVYAEEIPIQYVNDRADIQSGFINIKIW